MPRSSQSWAATSAYTLLEVLLVLSILAAISGLAWPVLMRPWSRSLAQQAAQEVTSVLLETRMRAIEESRVYEFRWKPGTSEYEVRAPHGGVARFSEQDRGAAETVGRIQTERTGSRDATNVKQLDRQQPTHLHQHLAFDIKFESSQLLAAMMVDLSDNAHSSPVAAPADDPSTTFDHPGRERRVESVEPQADSLPAPNEIAWNGGVWFYPDGTTSNGRWRLLTPERRQIDIVLRGITGTVRVDRPRPIVFP